MIRKRSTRVLALGIAGSVFCLAVGLLILALASVRIRAAFGAVYEQDPEAARRMADVLLSGKTGDGGEAARALGLTSRFFVYSLRQMLGGPWLLLGIGLSLLPLAGSLVFLFRERAARLALERRVEEALSGDGRFFPKTEEEAVLGKVLSAYRTERERSQAQEAEQRRRVENIAHELKTQAAGLSLNLDLVEDQGLTPDRLNRIRGSEEQIRRYVGDLLTLARLRAGKVRFLRETVDLAALLGTLAEEMPGVSFSRGGDAVIRGDWERLREAFHNLAANALRYGADGICRIRLTQTEERIRVEVVNRGGALPMLERYAAGKEDGTSTGLGTAIAAEIIQAHFGTLTAASDGGDTVLTAVFPLDHLKKKSAV